MYIYKMVFVERDELSEEAQQTLEDTRFMYDTDYGTVEIQADQVQDLYENRTGEEADEIKKALEELDEDILNALKAGEIDMVQVLY